MRSWGLWLLLSVTTGTARAQQPVTPESPSGAPRSAGSQGARFTATLTYETIAAELDALAGRFPELATLETIGQSSAGRPITVLTLTDSSTGAGREKPALLIADFSERGAGLGAEAILELGRALGERAPSERWIRALLAEATVILAPALDPDLRAGEEASPVWFDRNFPLGWQPESLRTGAGRVPLSRPETMAIARFLRERPEVTLLLGAFHVEPGPSEPWLGAEYPESDRTVLRALCRQGGQRGKQPLLAWDELGSPGGSLADYAYQALGIYPIGWSRAIPSDITPEKWIEDAVDQALVLVSRLPRVRLEVLGTSELVPGLWRVDLGVRNEGALPTISRVGAERRLPGQLWIELEGAVLSATAQQSSGTASFEAAALHSLEDGRFACGPMGPAEERVLRLIVEGEKGALVSVRASCTRAGTSLLQVRLDAASGN